MGSVRDEMTENGTRERFKWGFEAYKNRAEVAAAPYTTTIEVRESVEVSEKIVRDTSSLRLRWKRKLGRSQ